jgi:transcriptional regulator with XRE-family HTH domain
MTRKVKQMIKKIQFQETGEIVTDIVKSSGMTKTEFARKSGIKYQSFLNELRNSSTTGSKSRLWRLARAVSEEEPELFARVFLGSEPSELERVRCEVRRVARIADRLSGIFPDDDIRGERRKTMDFLMDAQRNLRLREAEILLGDGES